MLKIKTKIFLAFFIVTFISAGFIAYLPFNFVQNSSVKNSLENINKNYNVTSYLSNQNTQIAALVYKFTETKSRELADNANVRIENMLLDLKNKQREEKNKELKDIFDNYTRNMRMYKDNFLSLEQLINDNQILIDKDFYAEIKKALDLIKNSPINLKNISLNLMNFYMDFQKFLNPSYNFIQVPFDKIDSSLKDCEMLMAKINRADNSYENAYNLNETLKNIKNLASKIVENQKKINDIKKYYVEKAIAQNVSLTEESFKIIKDSLNKNFDGFIKYNQEMLSSSSMLIVIIFIFNIIIAILTVSFVVSPIRRLKNAIKKSTVGDYNINIPYVREKTEVGELAYNIDNFKNLIGYADKRREIKVFYAILELAENDCNLKETLLKASEIIRYGFNEPDLAAIKICVGNLHIKTSNFDEKIKSIAAQLKFNNYMMGTIVTQYPSGKEFMPAEMKFNNKIAKMLGALVYKFQIDKIIYLANKNSINQVLAKSISFNIRNVTNDIFGLFYSLKKTISPASVESKKIDAANNAVSMLFNECLSNINFNVAKNNNTKLEVFEIMPVILQAAAIIKINSLDFLTINVPDILKKYKIKAVKEDILSVFIALLNNSCEALKKVAKKEINLEIFSVGSGENSAVNIFIRDNGIGMSKELAACAFEPMFSEESSKLGVGLYCSRQIIRKYKGDITIISDENQGTAVKIIIPESS